MPLMTIRAKRLSNAIIRNLITAQEFDDLVSADGRDIEFADLIERPGQFDELIASSTAFAAVLASPTAMAAIANSPTALAAVAASPAAWASFIGSTALPTVSVPVMTSNTTPSGIASASSEGNPAWRAFDSDQGQTTRGWASNNIPSWLQYEFAEPVFIHSMDLTGYSGNSTDRLPKNFSIQVSDNGSVWETVFSGVNPQNTNKNTYSFTKSGKHKFWRISVTDNYGQPYTEIAQLNFRGFQI